MAVDDAARGAVKLVKWLAGQADDIVPSAEHMQRFGPNIGRVQSLLQFIPTLSEEAARSVKMDYSSPIIRNAITDLNDALLKSPAWRALQADKDGMAGSDAVSSGLLWKTSVPDVAAEAAMAESVSDLIDPQTYRILTNPLAAGRAVDVLRNRPRLKNTRFLDIARQAAERGAVTGPRDIVAVSRIAQKGEDVQEIALALMGDGMSAEQAMRTARMLAQ